MSDESASGSDPDLDPDVELEDAEEEEEEEEVAVEEHSRDEEEDLLDGECWRWSYLFFQWSLCWLFPVGFLRSSIMKSQRLQTQPS